MEKESKPYSYNDLLQASLSAGRRNILDGIRPPSLEKNHPYNLPISLLDIDAKSDERGRHNVHNLKRLATNFYGNLEENEENRGKFSEYVKEAFTLFKKASHGYFEQKEGFPEFEEYINETFIEKTPSYKDILKLFFIRGDEENVAWTRAILQRTLLFVYMEDVGLRDNLKQHQESLKKVIEDGLNRNGSDSLFGVYAVKIVEILKNTKSITRIAQKMMKKINLDEKSIADLIQLRFITKIPDIKDPQKKSEELERLAQKTQENLSKRKNSFAINTPGDTSRIEYKVEGTWEGTNTEMSIFEQDAYIRDELYGPYTHEVYEFIGDCHDLSRDGLLETKYVEHRIRQLSKLKTWNKIPEIAFQKISQYFGKALKNGEYEKYDVFSNKKGKKTKEKYFNISKQTAKDIIRERFLMEGFVNNPQNKKYYRQEDVLRKIPLVNDPEQIYEVTNLIKKMIQTVQDDKAIQKNNNRKKKEEDKIRLTEAEAWNILKGKRNFIHSKIMKALHTKYEELFEHDETPTKNKRNNNRSRR